MIGVHAPHPRGNMGLAHDEGWAIPFDAPPYPMLPAWY